MVLEYFGPTPFEITFNIINRILSLIALYFFIRLMICLRGTKIEQKPWKVLMIALVVFIIKKLAVSLAQYGILYIPSTLFNVIIVTLFIYALLLETERFKKEEERIISGWWKKLGF